MTGAIAYLNESATAGWERTLYAFLAEKERRSGSRRTVESYSRMLRDFFGRSAKTPDQATSQDIFAWAYGVGLSGRQPSSVTIGARLGCLSSFYRFMIRMKVIGANPCDAIERPRITPGVPRGLTADDVRRLLDVIPATPTGLRDRAIILTLVFTGRRRAEVFSLRAGDLASENGRIFYACGAIALGHPVGASGAILTVKLLHELERRQGRYGLVSLCIGGSQGIATVFERVSS